MNWVAVVPLKAKARKTRLADCLSDEQRQALSDAMAARVIDCLRRATSVSKVIVLAPVPYPGTAWIEDLGRGLNAELDDARASLGQAPMLVVHADLPAIAVDDVDALTGAAGDGAAIAPDRHGVGTNALAIGPAMPFQFAFGPGSFALHRSALPRARTVSRTGLAHDIDVPADIEELPEDIAIRLRRSMSSPCHSCDPARG